MHNKRYIAHPHVHEVSGLLNVEDLLEEAEAQGFPHPLLPVVPVTAEL